MDIEIKIWFTNNVSKKLEFLYISDEIIGIIKCKLGSDGRKFTKNGLRRKRQYSKDKAEFCYDELWNYLLDKENTEKGIKECVYYLEIECRKENARSWFNYDENNMSDVIEKLSELFWKEFNEIYFLDFLKPKEIKNYYA